jgi:hypothetical protein
LLIVPRDHIWIGEPYRYIERKPFLRTGEKTRRSERAIVVRGGFNSRFSIHAFSLAVRFTPESRHQNLACVTSNLQLGDVAAPIDSLIVDRAMFISQSWR